MVLIGAAASLQALREERYREPAPAAESLYLTSGSTVRRLSAGFSMLAADLYWIRAIQYYGGTRIQLDRAAHGQPATATDGARNFDQLFPLLDLTTTLDPRFNIAYRFGSIFLAEPSPGGAGRPDLAIALLEKGLREQPDKWEYMQDIGFVHYWWRHDYRSAGEWFARAADVPGAPWFLRSLAANTIAAGGDRRASRALWTSIGESADNDWLRNDAARRLKQLDALDVIEELQKGLDALTARTGVSITGWAELVRAGLVRGVPLDPAGTPYIIDQNGRVWVSRDSPLFPLAD